MDTKDSLKISKGKSEAGKLKKVRKYNGQKKNDIRRNNYLQKKTKDRVARTPLKPRVNSGAPEG